MKSKIEKKVENFGDKKITRKEAIKKTGLMAVSAATMMVLLQTKKAQATSVTGFGKSGSTTPVPQSSPGRRGPWKNKSGNGHQKQNGNGHQNHNGNGWGHTNN